MSLLKQIFGPGQKEVWTNLSEEIDASFVKGGMWKSNKVVARIREWTITLDTFAVHAGKTTIVFTRMRAPFISRDGFRFTIKRRSFFSGLTKFFGSPSVPSGFPDFDSKYIIKSKDGYKVQKLFANATIRELIESERSIHLAIRDDEGWTGTKFPSDVDELYFQVAGVVKDTVRLKKLFTLFGEVLGQLHEIGSANERDPGVTLK